MMLVKQGYDFLQPYFSYRSESNPLIFLHAICATRKSWRVVAPIIVNITGRKAFLIDARNHGESNSSMECDIDTLTQDVVDFMDFHSIQRAVLIGHSMGGRTAITFALKYPERTEAIIIEDMTPRNVKSGPGTLVHMILNLIRDNLKKIPEDADLSTVKRNALNFIFNFGKKEYSHSDDVPKHIVLASEVENERSKSLSPENSLESKFDISSNEFPLINVDIVSISKIDGKFKPECNQEAVELMLENNFLVQDLPKKNLTFGGKALFLYGDSTFFNLAEDPSVRKLFPKATFKKFKNAMHLIHMQHPEEYAHAVSHFILLNDSITSKY